MSTVKAINHQVGNDATATNNFTWYQPSVPDGTVRLGQGIATATSKDMVTVSGSTITLGGNLVQAATAAPAFSARATTGQAITSATFTKVTFDTEDFDTNNNFASSRFTPTVAGYYQINSTACCYAATTITRAINALYKNGSILLRLSDIQTGAGTFITTTGSAVVYMNGTTDYLEIYVWITGTGALQVNTATFGESSSFSAAMVRSA